MVLTNAIIDQAVVGNFRIGVFYPDTDTSFNQLKKAFSSVSFDARYRKLELGDRDSTTGWRDMTYDDTETREIILVTSQNRATVYSVTGILATYATTAIVIDPVFKGDQIATAEGWFEIIHIKYHTLGDSFLYRECELEYLPTYQEV